MSNKDTFKEQEAQRLAAKAERRADFIGRNADLVMVVRWVGYPIAMIISGLTDFASFYEAGKSVFVAISLALVIECGVYLLGMQVVDDFHDGQYNGSAADKKMFIIRLIAFACLFIFSINRSINGGPVIAEYLKQQNDSVELQLNDIASIEANRNQEFDRLRTYFQEERDGFEADKEAAKKMTWKGAIIKDGRKLIAKANEDISFSNAEEADAIAFTRNEYQAKIDTALAQNQRIILADQAKREANAKLSLGIVGMGQLIFVFCVIVVGIYDSKVQEELEAQQKAKGTTPSGGGSASSTAGTSLATSAATITTPSSAPVPATISTPSHGLPTASHKNPIGFGSYGHQNAHATPVATSIYNLEDAVRGLLNDYRVVMSDIKSNEAHLSNNHGDPDTVKERLKPLYAQKDQIINELEFLGKQVKKIKGRYTLIDL